MNATKSEIIGWFVSNPRRRYIDARITINDVDYDATIRLDCVLKSQKHLISIGKGFKLRTTGRISIFKLRKLTKKDKIEIDKRAKELERLLSQI